MLYLNAALLTIPLIKLEKRYSSVAAFCTRERTKGISEASTGRPSANVIKRVVTVRENIAGSAIRDSRKSSGPLTGAPLGRTPEESIGSREKR